MKKRFAQSNASKSALDHVEDIEDEDEPRILREPMDALQVYIKNALKVASDPDAQALTQGVADAGAEKVAAGAVPETPGPFPRAAGVAAAGAMAPGTPPLPGSMHRHPVGLFSTSPKFTAKSPFSTPGRGVAPASPRFNSVAASSVESPSETAKTPAAPASITAAPVPIISPKQSTRSTLTTVSDGPLSIAASPPKPKVSAKDAHPNRETVKIPASPSVPTSSTVITPPLDAPGLSPHKTINPSPKAHSTMSENPSPKKADLTSSQVQRRRVPRGLFSSELNSGPEPMRLPALDSEYIPGLANRLVSHGNSEESSKGHGSVGNSSNNGAFKPGKEADTEVSTITSSQISNVSSGAGNSPRSSLSQPQSPNSPLTSSISSLSTTGLKSPGSPPLQRSLPKPSPIQTTSINNTPRSNVGGAKSKPCQHDGDEEISQLAKDLERAMNPTPTEPVPQPYFLQGEGLLQRIPSQISMDDGLLNEDGDGQFSEESEVGEQQGEGSGLSRGNGSLHRQRSGSKRGFRISRSRSRNRSKGRQESRSKPALVPIEVGYPSALSSSEWPFDRSPPRGRSTVPPAQHQREAFRNPSQTYQWQPKTGPRLPFAESVSVGNPIRVGKGIASFTVYSITLKLCDPATAVIKSPTYAGRSRDGLDETERRQELLGVHAGHASEGSAATSPSHSRPLECPEAEGATGVAGQAESHGSMITKTPCKAVLMMTRSISSPDLTGSAERYLTAIQPGDGLLPPLPIDSATSAQGTPSHNTDSTSENATSRGQKVTPAERVIYTRKRYSDFVALRAQLVETLKDASRRDERDRRLLSRSSSSRHAAAASSSSSSSASSRVATVAPTNEPPSMTRSRLSEAYDDTDEDEEGYGGRVNGSHSRTISGASTSSISVSCSSILRGMPKLPPKKVVGKFRPAFVEKRRRELEYFLEWIVAHPVIGDCPVVVQWFLGHP
ncbi:hypothetical protein BGZ58_008282 [Dissophora ornata]|nr:hypothetical protein BGZ58_008282 [Dissophora ornata]